MSNTRLEDVLLIEGNDPVREALRKYLERHALRVFAVADAASARAALDCRTMDITVFDLTLPGADGFALAREIRAASWLPAVFVTDRADRSGRVTELGLAAEEYLVKPFNPRELLARIRATPSPGIPGACSRADS